MYALAAAIICACIVHAIVAAWTCDDAFVSIRYAQQLVAGNGLVFNTGERVEGYSNFAWTLWIAAGLYCGVDPLLWTRISGIAFFIATIALLWGAARPVSNASHARHGLGKLPIAALALALHSHSRIFASCGLETSMFAFWICAGVLQLIRAQRPRAWFGGGLLFVLAGMTRPDGMIVAVVCGLSALATRSWSRILAYAAPLMLGYGPFLLWRYQYYGSWVPNTYYAKSASEAWWSQGFYYLGLFFACYWLLALALPLAWWQVVQKSNSSHTIMSRRAAFLLAAVPSAYLLWVARVGGDFMFARFCLPVVPLLLLSLQRWAMSVSPAALDAELSGARAGHAHAAGIESRRRFGPGVVAGLIVGLAAIPGEVFRGRGIAEERDHYPPEAMAPVDADAERCRELFAGLDVRVCIFGGDLRLAVRADFDVIIEGETGLTDAWIAKQELPERRRPGHEKNVFLDPVRGWRYLQSRGVHFLIRTLNAGLLPEWTRLDLGIDRTCALVTWDRELMAALKGRSGVHFVDFEEWLDAYIAELPKKDPATVERDFAIFRGFYFDHNEDPQRERALKSYLSARAKPGG